MRKDQVRTPADALSYIVDCTLATVSSMAMRKSRSKYEYDRHISIAQHGVDWMRQMNVPIENDSRAAECIAAGSAQAWADQYDVKLREMAGS